VATGLTGTLTLARRLGAGEIFEFTLSDATEGGFFVDVQIQHVAFVDDAFDFGVLQKGATAFPNVVAGDLFNRTYSGVTVVTDSQFEISTVVTSSAAVDGVGNFTGSDSAGTTFNGFLDFDSARGRWIGSYQSNPPESGEVRAFISTDELFVGTWACSPDFRAFPACSYAAWRAN